MLALTPCAPFERRRHAPSPRASPRPPSSTRSHTPSPRAAAARVRPLGAVATAHYFPRRRVPLDTLAFGTYCAPMSATFDLCALTDYFNWDYKLAPRLRTDNRPVWR